jgi:predicted DNA-binding antitoxin AbrB/MazE fold protein
MPPIEVIYEKGVFRPLQPVELPEGATGEVLFTPTPAQSPENKQSTDAEGASDEDGGAGDSPGQRAYLLLKEIAGFPNAQPDERTDAGEHHDDILYPKHGKMP